MSASNINHMTFYLSKGILTMPRDQHLTVSMTTWTHPKSPSSNGKRGISFKTSKLTFSELLWKRQTTFTWTCKELTKNHWCNARSDITVMLRTIYYVKARCFVCECDHNQYLTAILLLLLLPPYINGIGWSPKDILTMHDRNRNPAIRISV